MDQHLREKTELDEPTKVSGAEEANEMLWEPMQEKDSVKRCRNGK